MSLDLTIHGDTAGIDRLADSLELMAERLLDVTLKVMESSNSATHGWYGEAADGFRTTASRVHVSQLPVNTYLDDAAQVFRAYAQRLRWGRDYFEEILHSAQNVGLEVRGTTIQYPTTWLTQCPDPAAPYAPSAPTHSAHPTGSRAYQDTHGLSPEMNEWNRYLRLVAAYNEASTKVGTWEGELNEWLADHMTPLVGRIPELAEIADIYQDLREGAHITVDLAIESAKARVELDMSTLRVEQERLGKAAADAVELAREGNPNRLSAYQAFDIDGSSARIGGLEAKIGQAAHYSRILGGATVITDIAFAAYEIAEGAPESTVLAKSVGGAAGGAAGANLGAGLATAIGVSNPAGVIAGTVVVASSVGSAVAGWLWESQVDLDTREAVSYWLRQNVLWNSDSGTLVAGS